MARRSKPQMVLSLLDFLAKNKATGNTKISRIMYGVNLSFSTAKGYLKVLMDEDLVNGIPSEKSSSEYKSYEISEKGYEFLILTKSALKKLNDICSKIK